MSSARMMTILGLAGVSAENTELLAAADQPIRIANTSGDVALGSNRVRKL